MQKRRIIEFGRSRPKIKKLLRVQLLVSMAFELIFQRIQR